MARQPHAIGGGVGRKSSLPTQRGKAGLHEPAVRRDEELLRQLLKFCREADFRNVKALVIHHPHLLSLLDRHGQTALHHAVLSGDKDFVQRVLALYQDPSNFATKEVEYMDSHQWLAEDLQFEGGLGEPLVVSAVRHRSCAHRSGIRKGDTLRAVGNDTVQFQKASPATVITEVKQYGFPIVLEFKGPVCAEIFDSKGWTPLHSAASKGAPLYGVMRTLLSSPHADADVKDSKGWTPRHWAKLAKKMDHRTEVQADPRERPGGAVMSAKGRPSSAGPPRGRPSSAGTFIHQSLKGGPAEKYKPTIIIQPKAHAKQNLVEQFNSDPLRAPGYIDRGPAYRYPPGQLEFK